MQNVWAIEFLGRGESTRIAPAADVLLADGPCIKCGQCSAHCPVGAIYENDQTKQVWDALMKGGDEAKTCVVQIAPAVRVALGEEFGLEPGTVITKKIYAALRRLGFDVIFDTNFSADLTIMEEGTEFVKRFVDFAAGKNKELMPLITSCCPAWVDYMEKYYDQDLLGRKGQGRPEEDLLRVDHAVHRQEVGERPQQGHVQLGREGCRHHADHPRTRPHDQAGWYRPGQPAR